MSLVTSSLDIVESRVRTDARFEAAIDLCMSFLANEGLQAPNLFRGVAPAKSVSVAMETVCQGGQIDYIGLNDPALCTGVMKECLRRMKKPLFPVHLVKTLSEAHILSKDDPPEAKHVRMKEVLTAAALAGTVSPTFLNLIGLLNLLEQNSARNGTSLSFLAATFAGDFLTDHGHGMQQNSPEWRDATKIASQIMMDLILHIYRMFPPHGEQPPPSQAEVQGQASSHQARGNQRAGDAVIPASSLSPKKNDPEDVGCWVGFGSGEEDVGTVGGDSRATPAVSRLFGLFDDPNDAKSTSNGKQSSALQNQIAISGELTDAGSSEEEGEKEGGRGSSQEEDEDEDEEEGEPVDLVAVAKHSYAAGDDDELSFQKGDKIRITWKSSWDHESQEGWFTGELNGLRGMLPSTYVDIVEENVKSASSSEPASPTPESNATPGIEVVPTTSTMNVSSSLPNSDAAAHQVANTPPSSPPNAGVKDFAKGTSTSHAPTLHQFTLGVSDNHLKGIVQFDEGSDDEPLTAQVESKSAQSPNIPAHDNTTPTTQRARSEFHSQRCLHEAQQFSASKASPSGAGSQYAIESRPAEHKTKVELLFGPSEKKRTQSDTKDAWKKALAWYKSGAGTGGGTSPGNSTRAYPGKILSAKSTRGESAEPDRTGITEQAVASCPLRNPPRSLPKKAAPRAADPSQYSQSWTRKWHTKILSDSDTKGTSVHARDFSSSHNSVHQGNYDGVFSSHEGTRKTFNEVEGDMQREKSDALEKVHSIRSSQRSRMKLYNASLVSATQRGLNAESSLAKNTSNYRFMVDREMGSLDYGFEGWEVEEDKYKYWTGNAAYRHIERQRKARILAQSKDPWNASGYKRSPPRIESARIGSTEGLVLDMSEAFRRSGTADNAKRGIRFMSPDQGTDMSSPAGLDWQLQDMLVPEFQISPENSRSRMFAAKSTVEKSTALRTNDHRSSYQRPEPLLYAVALVGLESISLEHADGGCTGSLKDDNVVAGPFKPQLLSLLTPKTTTSQDRDTVGSLISAYSMPCGAFIHSSPMAVSKYSVMLPRNGLAPLSLHCHFRYRHEFGTALAIKYGGGGPIYVPECIIVASESVFHDTLRSALSCVLNSVAVSSQHSTTSSAPCDLDSFGGSSIVTVVKSSMPTLQLLLETLACAIPPPGMPLYLQIGQSSLHCPRPDPRDLPLADIDFAPLLRALDSRNTARLLMLLLLEPQVVLVADSVEDLFPSIVALMQLIYPFSWAFPVVPVLPPSRLSFLDSPHPYIVGVHRACLPRGRLSSNFLVADLSQNTLTIPPSISCEGLEAVEVMLETRISACKDALLACVTLPQRAVHAFRAKSTVLPENIVAPGACGTSVGNSSGMHAAVESLRLNVAADFSQIFFRYPLYLQTPNHGVVFDAIAFSAASDEHSAFIRAVSSTRLFTGMLNARYSNWLPSNGSVSCLLDVFDANVKRRLEAESVQLHGTEDGDLSGFLFVQESDESSDASVWNLKWCELGKRDLKAFTFQAPSGLSATGSSASLGQDEEKTMTVQILPNQTFLSTRVHGRRYLKRHKSSPHSVLPSAELFLPRDPTSYGFEVRAGAVMLSLCAKDKKTRSKWMNSIRKRALGNQIISKLRVLCQ